MDDKTIKVRKYINKIDSLLPYSKTKKEQILNRLESDVLESLKDANSNDPEKVFGDPEIVARNVSKSQNWIRRATYKRRATAYIIDMIIQNVAILVGFIVWFSINGLELSTNGTANTSNNVFALLSFFLILIPYVLLWILGYFIILEKFFNKTIGKFIMKLMVVDESGIQINWFQAIIRNLTKSQIFLLFVETLIGYYQKTDYQRPLEVVAKTIVIMKG